MAGGAHEEGASGAPSEVCSLVSEAHALCYALVMALSATPREDFTRDEVDALCQVAYELLNKLNKAVERCANPDAPSRSD